MHNLRTLNGSFKGTIGECMFKLTRKWAVLPRFFSKPKYFSIFGKYLTSSQASFISENWYSIDAVEILFANGKKEVTLFEIKTKNVYSTELFFKPKMTLAIHNLYTSAKEIGFQAKLATVIFHDNWDYEVVLSDFVPENYCIDKPKQYDRIL